MDPKKGNVLVDKTNIKTNLLGWQKNLGYVPQSIFLSDDSLKNNVAFGLNDDPLKNDKVEKALTSAQLLKYINKLDRREETFVGERGVKLSGGQRQRIGIARALYNNPNILVFDEATSSLDYDTENEIMKTVENLKDKTIIIVAHRINTLKICDKIYELKFGKLIQKDFKDLN